MNEYTPPPGGPLSHTEPPNPGERIAAAVSSLHSTPPPGWLYASWVGALENGEDDFRAGPRPRDVQDLPGFRGCLNFPPGHEGISPEAMRHKASGPFDRNFAGELGLMLHERLRVWMPSMYPGFGGCVCGACMPTGVPPGLSAYLESVAREGQLNRPDHSTAADPYAGMRYTVALEVAAARAMREAYIRALYDGPSPAEWLREAHNLNHDGHYLARMSDDGLATTMCALWWWRPNIDAQESGSDTAVGYLYPVELVAALAVGFAYPIPKAGSAEWERQAREEADLDGVFACELLNHTTADLAELLADGVPPWDAGGCKGGAA